MLRAKITYIFIFIWLSGCSQTIVTNKELDPGILIINQSNQQLIDLSVNSDIQNIGVQFGFIILPLGRIKITDSQKWLYQSLAKHLIVNGYKIENSNNTLDIKLEALSCNVYDLLFVRWIRCSSNLLMEYKNRKTTMSEVSNRFSSFGFNTDIKICLDKLGQQISSKILAKLQ